MTTQEWSNKKTKERKKKNKTNRRKKGRQLRLNFSRHSDTEPDTLVEKKSGKTDFKFERYSILLRSGLRIRRSWLTASAFNIVEWRSSLLFSSWFATLRLSRLNTTGLDQLQQRGDQQQHQQLQQQAARSNDIRKPEIHLPLSFQKVFYISHVALISQSLYFWLVLEKFPFF